MKLLSGWRAALVVLVALVVVALLLTAFFWLAVVAGVIAGVAAFNLLAVPRLARRLRVPELAIVASLLVVLAVGGFLVGGPVAAAAGTVAWLVGVLGPRLVLRRFRQQLELAELRTQSGRPVVVDLERAPIGAGAADDDAVVTFRRPE
ncbi:MAG: hypothetical protein JO057_11695 [Chloroflexi bacterium]|nr:hypothetical protein [Chloroflexota bacterium]